MKLARYSSPKGTDIGVVVDDRIIGLKGVGIAVADMIDIIEGGPEMRAHIAQGIERNQEGVPVGSVKLLAPLRPRKFLALGMNYRRHADEARRLGVSVPDNQVWFNKQTSCINGPYGDIDAGVTEKLDYEVELGVVIGRSAKSVKSADALDHVFGYLVVNDVSARDWQFHSSTFTVGKSFDTHGPIGPWIVTADEIVDPAALSIRSFVNGAIRQDSNTDEFIHSIGDQIEYLSTAFTLEPGDIISTGTPEGVGAAMSPPCFLKSGDVVRCEIEGIGAIENRIA